MIDYHDETARLRREGAIEALKNLMRVFTEHAKSREGAVSGAYQVAFAVASDLVQKEIWRMEMKSTPDP